MLPAGQILFQRWRSAEFMSGRSLQWCGRANTNASTEIVGTAKHLPVTFSTFLNRLTLRPSPMSSSVFQFFFVTVRQAYPQEYISSSRSFVTE